MGEQEVRPNGFDSQDKTFPAVQHSLFDSWDIPTGQQFLWEQSPLVPVSCPSWGLTSRPAGAAITILITLVKDQLAKTLASLNSNQA